MFLSLADNRQVLNTTYHHLFESCSTNKRQNAHHMCFLEVEQISPMHFPSQIISAELILFCFWKSSIVYIHVSMRCFVSLASYYYMIVSNIVKCVHIQMSHKRRKKKKNLLIWFSQLLAKYCFRNPAVTKQHQYCYFGVTFVSNSFGFLVTVLLAATHSTS